MRFFRFKDAALFLCSLTVASIGINATAPVSQAQTITTGALSGVVADATGAVVPGANVVVIDAATDARQTVMTNAAGRYTVGLLKPGTYRVTASAASMKSDTCLHDRRL
jgi:uncharacterized surface anchored protein